MKRERFAKVVEEALDSLPQEFRSRIRNVAVLVVCEQIRLTVIHELGHYFGLDENQLKDV